MFAGRLRGVSDARSSLRHDKHSLCLPDILAEVLKVVVPRAPTHTSSSRPPAQVPRTPPLCSHSERAATSGGGHSSGSRRGLTRCSIAAPRIKVPPEALRMSFAFCLALAQCGIPHAGKIADVAADI